MIGASAEEDPLLEVSGLSVVFRHRKRKLRADTTVAVSNVSFYVAKGETLALVGESGSGKTTTSKAVLRLISPTSGHINFMGRPWFELSKRQLRLQRRHMQAVFQDPYSSLNPRRRVRDIIADPLVVHGDRGSSHAASEQVEQLLAKVGLRPDDGERFPHEFSGGQRQRIAIARALALNPSLIICDEAVSALDVSIQAQIINLLKGLQDELGISYLFISHDLGVVRSIAHRVAVMCQGEIVESGSSDELYSSPQHPYTQRLLTSVPIPKPSLERARE